MPPRRGKASGTIWRPKSPSYRFKVGDGVLCRTANGWEPGQIIKLDYSIPGDPTLHPYQVELKTGRLIYVPCDDDSLCKQHIVAWWEGIMECGDLSDDEGVAYLTDWSRGEDVNAKNHMGDSALHACLRYDWVPGVEALLSLRADPNLGGERNERPLSMAVHGGTALVKMLLEAQADPSLQDEDPEKDPNYESKSFQERKWHRSALHYAVLSSREITMILLDAQADINQADAQYKQPLHLAIEENLTDVVDLLIASRADVNTGNMSMGLNSNPLLEAVHKSDIKLIQQLIAARSDVNRQGKQNLTPLHMAARSRHLEAARILLEARADVNIEANGKTAAQLAAKNGASELANMLGHEGAAIEAKSPVLDAELRKQLFLD